MSGFLLGTALTVLGASLGGCEPPEMGPEETDGGDTAKAGTASLSLTNLRETDPGPITFLLYKPTAQDIENVAPAATVREVGFGSTSMASATAGRWKVAYRLISGDLRPMPPKGDESISEDWPVVNLEKGRSYTIRIETDDGGHTVWRTNLPVEE